MYTGSRFSRRELLADIGKGKDNGQAHAAAWDWRVDRAVPVVDLPLVFLINPSAFTDLLDAVVLELRPIDSQPTLTGAAAGEIKGLGRVVRNQVSVSRLVS